ncbi:MAG TPA: acyltransferase [Thermoleophilaceae bacterium]
MTPRHPRFPLFDSLRAIAACSVLLFHVGFVLEGFESDTFGRYVTQLNIGVAIFFVISGFLLYRPFVQARFSGDPPPALVPYAIRRAFRILPAFWVVLPLAALWLSLDEVFDRPLIHFGLLQAYQRDTLTTGLGYAWTLTIEISFYAMLPVVAYLLRQVPARSTRRLVLTEGALLAAMFAFSLVWNITQTQSHRGFILFTPEIATLPAFLDHFALGMGLAVASVALAGRATMPAAVRVVERHPWVPWLVAAGAWLWLCNVGDGFAIADGETRRHELRGLVAVCLLMPAVFGQGAGGLVRRLLASRPMLWLGLVSYSLYLWHPPIARKVAETHLDEDHGWLPAALAIVALSIAVAVVSYNLVERPAMWAGRHLARRAGRREPPEAVAAGAGAGLGSPATEAPVER